MGLTITRWKNPSIATLVELKGCVLVMIVSSVRPRVATLTVNVLIGDEHVRAFTIDLICNLVHTVKVSIHDVNACRDSVAVTDVYQTRTPKAFSNAVLVPNNATVNTALLNIDRSLLDVVRLKLIDVIGLQFGI